MMSFVTHRNVPPAKTCENMQKWATTMRKFEKQGLPTHYDFTLRLRPHTRFTLYGERLVISKSLRGGETFFGQKIRRRKTNVERHFFETSVFARRKFYWSKKSTLRRLAPVPTYWVKKRFIKWVCEIYNEKGRKMLPPHLTWMSGVRK